LEIVIKSQGKIQRKGGKLMPRLEMNFINGEGTRTRLSMNDAREDLTGLDVKSAMDTIIEQNVFDFAQAQSARLVRTTYEDIELPVE
jgi:hypothetical protein